MKNLDDSVAAALSSLDAEDPAMASDARVGWEALMELSPQSGPTQACVQQLCWAQLRLLPMTGPDEQWEVAQALGFLLQRVGRMRYARIADSAVTKRLLYIADEEHWRQEFSAVLDDAGIEPADTGLVTWQEYAADAELLIIERIGQTLEVATVAGEFDVPPAADAAVIEKSKERNQARRRELTNAVLLTASSGQTHLEDLLDARLELWSKYSAPRGALYADLAEFLHAARDPALGVVHRSLALLRMIGTGVELTDFGYLPPTLVRDAMATLWTDEDWPFPIDREIDAEPVHRLRGLLTRLRLLRRYRGQLQPTARAGNLTPQAMWEVLTHELVGREYAPEALVSEVILAAVVRGQTPDIKATAVFAATLIAAEGWRYSEGDEPSDSCPETDDAVSGDAVSGDALVPMVTALIAEERSVGLLDGRGRPTADGITLAAAILRNRLLHTRFPAD